MTKQQQSKTTSSAPRQPLAHVRIAEYEITSEPVIELQDKRIPKEVKSALERLHSIVQARPHTAIPELVALIQAHPNIPKLYNYLSIAYSAAGDTEKAEEVVTKNYQLHPDYLFARMNYAEVCLRRNDYDAVAQIFNHKFDLKLLYPKRKCFHISEFTGFFGIIGPYFYHTGQQETAENVYQLLYQVDPKNYYTKRLKRLLYPNFFQRLFRSGSEEKKR